MQQGWPEPTTSSPSASPPPPPAPTRTPPPIPGTVQPPCRAEPEEVPELELPPSLLAQLIASLQAGEDINNLKQSLDSEATGRGVGIGIEAQAGDAEADQSVEHFPALPPPPPLQKVNTQHSHHSSKNSAGHSYAFAGGRSHKASLASTGSGSSRCMTTEEKMSEVDEFFGLDGDHDDGVPVAAGSVAGSQAFDAALAEGSIVGLDRLMEDPTT